MQNSGSEVVELIKQGKALAWEDWWSHVTKGRAAADYDDRERELWAVFEEAAEVLAREVDLRAEMSGRARAAA